MLLAFYMDLVKDHNEFFSLKMIDFELLFLFHFDFYSLGDFNADVDLVAWWLDVPLLRSNVFP